MWHYGPSIEKEVVKLRIKALNKVGTSVTNTTEENSKKKKKLSN